MSSTAPDASTQSKFNPKTLKYLKTTFDIVDRAITQADIVFPTSGLIPIDSQEYYEFKERSTSKLDGIVEQIDPTVSGGMMLKIIVETQISVNALVSAREQGREADLERFKKLKDSSRKL